MKNLLFTSILLFSISSLAGEIFYKHSIDYGNRYQPISHLRKAAMKDCKELYNYCYIVDENIVKKDAYKSVFTSQTTWKSGLVIVYGENKKVNIDLDTGEE